MNAIRCQDFPVRVVDGMDMEVQVDSGETKQWYHRAFPDREGMSFGEGIVSAYGVTEPLLRNGKVVGYMWLAH